MKIYAYYLRTESGDEILKMSYNDYKNAPDFMKNEVPGEYECWFDEDYEDEDIPYASFIKKEMEVKSGIEKATKFENGVTGCHDWEFTPSDNGVQVYNIEQGDVIGFIENITIDEVFEQINNKTYEQVRNWIDSIIEYY